MAINAVRSERRTDEYLKLSQSTNEVVAPGTYDPGQDRASTEALAPFMSMQDRVLNPLPWSKCTPGPGAYSGPDLSALPGAGLSQMPFKSKMKRMAASTPGSTVFTESTIAKNPGPGTYHPKHSDKTESTLDVQPAVKPIIKDLEKTTPSVPPMRYLPGQVPQTEAATADIAKLSSRHSGERGDTAGPGEYQIQGSMIVDSPVPVFRKPPHRNRKLWEASVSIDSRMPPSDLPGPGAYETKVKSTPRGAESRFNSKVPKMSKDAAKTPGPGAYDVVGHIEKASAETQDRCEAIQMSLGFGSLTERVGWSREVEHPFADPYNVNHVPGPGHYTHGGSVKESLDREKVLPEKRKKLYGVHHPTLILALQETEGPLQAFNTSDDRPCNKDLEQWTPAPWQYTPESARGTSITSDLKERAKVGRRGVFGSCADRFYRSPLKAKDGPEIDWDGGKVSIGKDSPEARSSFKSTSPRMRAEGAKEVEVVTLGDVTTPAPGDYEIKDPNYRSPYRIPRSDHLSFGSGKTRFTEKQEVFAPFQLPDGPAPNQYMISSKRHIQGAPNLKDKRKPMLVGSTASGVGPGSYEGGDTLLKKTFNVTTQARSLIARREVEA